MVSSSTTSLSVLVERVNGRTGARSPEPGVSVSVVPTNAVLSGGSATDAQGRTTFQVTPTQGAMALSLLLNASASDGISASAQVMAQVTQLAGSYVGTGLEYDGQDTPPITPSMRAIQMVMTDMQGTLRLTYASQGSTSTPPPRDTYTITISQGMISGSNGLSGGSLRTITGTISGNRISGRIDIRDTSDPALWSWIEYDVTQ
jgi:hypothetical protein